MVFFDQSRPRRKAELMDDAEFEKLVEPFGGIEAFQKRMERGHLAGLRMEQEWRALMEQYPNQWVAMDADGLAAAADSQEALLAALAAKSLRAGDLAIKFLPTNPGSGSFDYRLL